jgi:3-hydroxybutyryl-CoA dehydrogenase
MVNEAHHAAGEGVAAPSDIDLAMKLGANHPWGPFERTGQLGGATVVRDRLRALESVHGERFAPAPLLLATRQD